MTISPVRDDTGRVIAASKIARDISDRRKTDETRYRLAAIVDSADDAIISKDLNGIIRTWNQGAQRMFGYSAEEMIGQPVLRLIPPELHYEEDEILRKLRAGDRIDHYETTRRKKNGKSVEVSVTISPIRDHSGRVIGASKSPATSPIASASSASSFSPRNSPLPDAWPPPSPTRSTIPSNP